MSLARSSRDSQPDRGAAMKWIELTVEVDLEAVEPVSELLGRYAYGGIAVERLAKSSASCDDESLQLDELVRVRGYFPAKRGWKQKRARIEVAISLLGQLRTVGPLQWRMVGEEDWSSLWKQHYHPLRIGQRIVVKPSWEEYHVEPGQVLVELDPGMAFGTGLHPTTQLCLQQLERWLPSGAVVLDLGTGSGILAIAAARLGAASILALDTDPLAVETARRNVTANGLANVIRIEHGSLDWLSKNQTRYTASRPSGEHAQAAQSFDLVVANITASVICELSEGLVRCLRPGGALIAGGIIDQKVEMVAQALESSGLSIRSRERMGDWIAIVGTR